MDAAIRLAGGSGGVERAMRRQLVDAAIVLLAGHFQLCCRELHGEAARFLSNCARQAAVSEVVGKLFLNRRSLSRGNASSAALADDFGRFGIEVWRELVQHDPRNVRRRERLDQLNVWRNAIAHQDLHLTAGRASIVGATRRDVRSVRTWRHTCSALAHNLDTVVKRHLIRVADGRPW